MTVEFLEIVEDPPKPVYEVVCRGQRVGELFWDEVGPQYWFLPEGDVDLSCRDVHAIYSRMVALTLDNGGNPGYRFPSEMED